MTDDTEVPGGIEEFVAAMANLLEEGADVFLQEVPASLAESSASTWSTDRQVWGSKYDSDDVGGWVSESSGIYLAESAHLLRGLASLLRSGRVFSTQDAVVRCVLERVGHVNWILDHRITAEQRAARGALEVGASYVTYREGLSLLGADRQVKTDIKEEARKQREKIDEWFTVERPASDPNDESSGPTGDVRLWVADGEAFPSLTRAAELALEQGGIEHAEARGTYAALSGFSHPNVVFSREHRTIDDGGHVTFRYERESIEKAVRLALFSFSDGIKHWVGYYSFDVDRIVAKLDAISAKLESICDRSVTDSRSFAKYPRNPE